jgi:NitT/TauT family transport system permease protein
VSRFGKVWPPLLVAAALYVLWWAATAGQERSLQADLTARFPSPSKVLEGFQFLLTTQPGDNAPLLVTHLVASVFRVIVGFTLAAALGIPLGLLMGWYGLWYRALNPFVQLLRPISPIAWIPFAILWFRSDEPRSIFLIFISTFFPIAVSTAAGVQNIPLVYIRSAANFAVERWMLFKKVVLPAVLPQVLTGLRIAIGIGWMVIVAAEMIAVRSGLGRGIQDARDKGSEYGEIFALMLTIGLIGIGLDFLLRRLENLDQLKWGYVKRG